MSKLAVLKTSTNKTIQWGIFGDYLKWFFKCCFKQKSVVLFSLKSGSATSACTVAIKCAAQISRAKLVVLITMQKTVIVRTVFTDAQLKTKKVVVVSMITQMSSSSHGPFEIDVKLHLLLNCWFAALANVTLNVMLVQFVFCDWFDYLG